MEFPTRFGAIDWRRLATLVGVAAFLVVLAVFVVAAVPQLVGADESYVVRSNSMSPTIEAGSVVFVSDVPTDRVAEGDVITYVDRGPDGEQRRVTHRVVEVVETDGQRQFRTKGDANEEPDPGLVGPDAVVGVVDFDLPFLGYVLSILRSPLGIVTLVVVPAVALGVTELWAMYREANEDDDTGGDAS